jgi:hypothetical protein
MSRLRWFRTATVATLVMSTVAFGTAWPAQANPDEAAAKEATAAQAAATPADMIGKGRPVTATKATIEEIQAAAAKGEGKLFTLSADGEGASVSYTITCLLKLTPPFGGLSAGVAVQADAIVQCSDWVDIISLYVLLYRDVSKAADSAAAAPFIPALYVSAKEATCRNGIYWAVATAFVRRSGFTPVPSPWVHDRSLPIPVGCGSTPPPLPPPVGAMTVTNPGNQFSYKWTTTALQMRATGGSGTYAWAANGLPPGLSINPSTGLIAGNPSVIGTFSVTVTAVAGVGSSNFTNFTWVVGGEPCPRC